MRSVARGLLASLVTLLVLLIASCDASEADGTVVRAGPMEAVALIRDGDHAVVDLRSPRDFEAGHVAGAVNIDASAADFQERVGELDPSVPYLVYARSSEESTPAAEAMVRSGIERVVDAGAFGMLALADADLEG